MFRQRRPAFIGYLPENKKTGIVAVEIDVQSIGREADSLRERAWELLGA